MAVHITGEAFARILEQRGWDASLTRQIKDGPFKVYAKAGKRISVPISPPDRIIETMLLRDLLREAHLTEADLEVSEQESAGTREP